ncbi:putative membrane protein YeiB [Saccharothrix saharensis]|uniref:Putative membrane protein YeiB n=2 Tax=Saccharothrix saharensis TaxID=571190 RepID=A0A543J4N2_9PSEU|nr:putative membrane protein YeiB [Saccharothrix saharensis]
MVDRPLAGGRALAPDVARGAMLLMIALAHAHMYLYGHPTGFRAYALDGGPLDRVVTGLQVALVDGRAMPMFAALFGYGFVQLASKRTDDWPTTRRVLRRRSRWLLLFGCGHAVLLFFGDILAAYGLAGLLLVGVLRWRDRTVLALAGAWLLVHAAASLMTGLRIAEFGGASNMVATADPVAALGERVALWAVLTPFLVVELVVPVLLGVWAARRRLLDEPGRHVTTLRRTAWFGLGSAVLGGLPLALVDAGVWTPGGLAVPAYVLHGITGLAGGLGYAALVGLVAARATRPGRVLTGLAACGRRSLTCYLLQSVVFVAVFVPYAGGLGAELGTAAASGIAVLTWLAAVVLADALRRADLGGPAEWLLRRLTYGRRGFEKVR